MLLPVFFGALASLTLCASGHPHASVKSRPELRPTARPSVDELYSLRARRRMAAYLRLRLLEWREEGLERAAAVVERRLPIDALVPKP
jgi:hypothetical protein